MKTIGGYLEMEQYNGREFHNRCHKINSARNSLRIIIQEKKIKKIFLPFFVCNSVIHACLKEKIDFEFYNIDYNFNLLFDKKLKNNDYLYIVNYYGQMSNNYLKRLYRKYKNVIVDNVQAFFQRPILGVDTLYSCRKYFGVPDGSYLYTDNVPKNLRNNLVYNKMEHIFGRYELNPETFYNKFQILEESFEDNEIKTMSKVTENILKSIDYKKTIRIRNANYKLLHKAFKNINGLQLIIPKGPFSYPLLLKNGKDIRKKLINNNIFIPLLWPNIDKKNVVEYDLAQNILPIPCDQRYSKNDMEYLIDVIKNVINS